MSHNMNIYLHIDFGSVFVSTHLSIPETHITRPIPPENNRAANHISIHPIKALINIFFKIKIYNR